MKNFLKLNFSPKNKQWWFTMRASNGKVLMHSEMYTTKRGAERGMAAVRKLLGISA
jgi:uncharacterized protein YegP (UPF0339 family)